MKKYRISKKLFFLFLAGICILQYTAEVNIRGDIPPNSDSLVYQSTALNNIASIQKGAFSVQETLNLRKDNPIPPFSIILIQIFYMFFGINNTTPYILSAFWMFFAGLLTFYIVFLFTRNRKISVFASFWLISLPVSLTFGFMETRNDWPATILTMSIFYFIIKSDLIKQRFYSLLFALFTGLALLTKSSVVGYLSIPFLGLFLLLMVDIKKANAAQFKTYFLVLLTVLLISAWFYIFQWKAILEYYSFFSGQYLENVRIQYGLKNRYDELLFYYKNAKLQVGMINFFALFIGCISFFVSLFRLKKNSLRKSNLLLVLFAFSPYLVLTVNRSYATIADINMIPFLVIIAAIGINQLLVRNKEMMQVVLLLFSLGCNAYSIFGHYKMQKYFGVETIEPSKRIIQVALENNINNVKLWSLFQDVYFNPATIQYNYFLDPISKARVNIEFIDLPLSDFKSEVNNKYKIISSQANILLAANKVFGPIWIVTNQEIEAMNKLIEDDNRFYKEAVISPYDDKSISISVFVKKEVKIKLTEDEWLINEAEILIPKLAGNYTLRITGKASSSSLKDLKIMLGNQNISGKECFEIELACFQFNLSSPEKAIAKVISKSYLNPLKSKINLDSRDLILHQPTLKLLKERNE